MNKIEILTMMDNELDKAVKIQGTEYDRKRKVKDVDIRKMSKMYNEGKGKSIAEISRKMGLAINTVRYNVDPIYRAQHLAKCSGKHTGKDTVTPSNRIAYKRKLVAAGKVTA